jgi:RimJ/RimL family protein N-acetyltransferase
MGRQAAISYWLAPEARGRGWASDALRTGSAWANATWEVEHLELEIDPQNEASIKVATAAGYRRHGIRLESACGGPALLFRRP